METLKLVPSLSGGHKTQKHGHNNIICLSQLIKYDEYANNDLPLKCHVF